MKSAGKALGRHTDIPRGARMRKCEGCRAAPGREIPFTMAFQPIVDSRTWGVWGYEALVRGPDGQGAFHVIDQIDEQNRYWFDQAFRVRAIEMAASLFPAGARLSINFLPNAVYEPRACIQATLAAAERTGFDPHLLMFEFTEDERISDHAHIRNIVDTYRALGFTTALDDFGAGHAGLSLLARLQTDLIKIDMELVRGIETSRPRQAIVRGLKTIADELGIRLLAEGVESEAEFAHLHATGIELFQGYLFAKPQVAALPEVRYKG